MERASLTASYRVTGADVDRYARASGDLNPIHLDDAAAAAAGLPGRIAHGMLAMGLMTSAASRWVGGADRIVRVGCRFSGMVLVGDTVTFHATVEEAGSGVRRIAIEAVQQDGRSVLTRGVVEHR